MSEAKMTSKGQITVPKDVRQRLGLKPGDRVRLSLVKAGRSADIEAVLGHRLQRSFKIIPGAHPTPQQTAILADWMKAK